MARSPRVAVYLSPALRSRIDSVVTPQHYSWFVRTVIETELDRRARATDDLEMHLQSCNPNKVRHEVFVPSWQVRMKADYDRETEELLALLRRNQLNEQEEN